MTWHIVTCTSGKEAACVALLDRKGYPRGWYPTERVEKRQRASKTRKHVNRPIITGYVFVQCDHIEVYPINSHEGAIWMRVVAPNGYPYRVSDEVMAQMKHVPKRLGDLAAEIKRLEAEAAAARMPVIGQVARITDGLLQGHSGQVMDLMYGLVRLDTVEFGKVSVPQEMVERVA